MYVYAQCVCLYLSFILSFSITNYFYIDSEPFFFTPTNLLLSNSHTLAKSQSVTHCYHAGKMTASTCFLHTTTHTTTSFQMATNATSLNSSTRLEENTKADPAQEGITIGHNGFIFYGKASSDTPDHNIQGS